MQALAQDQLRSLLNMTSEFSADLKIGVYDGDTSQMDRKWQRDNARLVFSKFWCLDRLRFLFWSFPEPVCFLPLLSLFLCDYCNFICFFSWSQILICCMSQSCHVIDNSVEFYQILGKFSWLFSPSLFHITTLFEHFLIRSFSSVECPWK